MLIITTRSTRQSPDFEFATVYFGGRDLTSLVCLLQLANQAKIPKGSSQLSLELRPTKHEHARALKNPRLHGLKIRVSVALRAEHRGEGIDVDYDAHLKAPIGQFLR